MLNQTRFTVSAALALALSTPAAGLEVRPELTEADLACVATLLRLPVPDTMPAVEYATTADLRAAAWASGMPRSVRPAATYTPEQGGALAASHAAIPVTPYTPATVTVPTDNLYAVDYGRGELAKHVMAEAGEYRDPYGLHERGRVRFVIRASRGGWCG